MSENMLFCLGEENIQKGIGYQHNNMVFNQQVTETEFNEIKRSLPEIKLPVTCWIDKKEMTKDEKDDISGWSEMGGYLKTLGYEEAWRQWWDEAKNEDKEKILNCKFFDAEIFTGITGLKDFKTKSLKGKKVEVKIDGQEYTAIIQ